MIVRFGNVAVPDTAGCVVVPPSKAPDVPVPVVMVIVTLPVNVVAVNPLASCAVTLTPDVLSIRAPATVAVG